MQNWFIGDNFMKVFFEKEMASFPLGVDRVILAFFGTMCICLQLGSFFVPFVQVALSLFVAF